VLQAASLQARRRDDSHRAAMEEMAKDMATVTRALPHAKTASSFPHNLFQNINPTNFPLF
jgi:hypothetical protein